MLNKVVCKQIDRSPTIESLSHFHELGLTSKEAAVRILRQKKSRIGIHKHCFFLYLLVCWKTPILKKNSWLVSLLERFTDVWNSYQLRIPRCLVWVWGILELCVIDGPSVLSWEMTRHFWLQKSMFMILLTRHDPPLLLCSCMPVSMCPLLLPYLAKVQWGCYCME